MYPILMYSIVGKLDKPLNKIPNLTKSL